MTTFPTVRVHRAAAVLAVSLAAAACASGGGGAANTRVRVETAAVTPTDSAALPALPSSQMEVPRGPAQRIEQLQVVNEELPRVIRGLAENFGLDYEIDPGVTGRVTTRLSGVTLQQALDALVVPHGYAYEIQGKVLRVSPARMPTRIFTLDYLSMSRSGVGSTIIQRRLQNSGATQLNGVTGSGGLFGTAGGGADLIQSVAVSDLWAEIRISLEGLIFDSTTATTSGNGLNNPTALNNPAYGLAAQTPGATSRVGPDGRRLILNPMSGTIVVSAPAEKLAQVASFLSTVEASVQRQVLIEAKIVEVTLSHRSEFGLDWSFLRKLGGLNVQIGGDATNGVQFTLSNASASDPGHRVSVVLHALEEQGNVKVLSSPRVSVLNNQRAVINVTTDEVFFTVTRQPVLGPNGGTIGFTTEVQPQQIAVGIVLDVFPQISKDNTITMSVRPVITNVVDVKSLSLPDETQVSAPVIDRRETDTVVRVRGGETVVIGGLVQTTRRESDTGVPILNRIPLLGRLFGGSTRNDEKRELVIFLTPTVVAGQPPTAD